MMLLPVAAWSLISRARGVPRNLPWAGFALIGAPFLIDVSGNTLDLYDSIWWWDDANHYFNWMLLCLGVGFLIERGGVRPRWAMAVTRSCGPSVVPKQCPAGSGWPRLRCWTSRSPGCQRCSAWR